MTIPETIYELSSNFNHYLRITFSSRLVLFFLNKLMGHQTALCSKNIASVMGRV